MQIYTVKQGCENMTRYTAKGGTQLGKMSQKDIAAWAEESPVEVAQYFDIADDVKPEKENKK